MSTRKINNLKKGIIKNFKEVFQKERKRHVKYEKAKKTDSMYKN